MASEAAVARAKATEEKKKELKEVKKALEKAEEEEEKFRKETKELKERDPRKATPTLAPKKGVIKVHIYQGMGLLACDVGGTSDPFLVLSLLEKDGKEVETFKGPVHKKTLEPIFNYSHTYQVDEEFGEGRSIVIEIFDKDLIGKDFMGQLTFELNEKFWKGDCAHFKGDDRVPKTSEHKLRPKKAGKAKQFGKLLMYVAFESDEMKEKVETYEKERVDLGVKSSAAFSARYEVQGQVRKLEDEIKFHPLDEELISAVLDVRVNKVKEALEKGADPSCCSQHTGTCVINMAATKKSVEILLLLRQYGANLSSEANLYGIFTKAGPNQAERKEWDADPELLSMREAREKSIKIAAEERRKKELEEKKFQYCLVTGKTGYE
eukprot:CAMPEP_0201528520 /NCGR_PEP_ID=MMETSP0161_2-20130828/38518_1 /ASSEMBLY_ACC=CAM_ASM_000251 /TAXON_ID=180227 /ORGANISM="Neoparamoeba aestuarina, Strain SoJaBio B1-5/56/2" /LENGTH=378 /DNA_ID=CAMNT_0047929815 /DNA_START=95 /DNA_END=1228 /DNA_ORIENTATION=+